MGDLVSVIIPCHNQGAYLDEALRSVVGQTYVDLEVVVVNDGSTDSTLDVARAYGNRIRLIDQPNRGRSAARNVGLEAARGEFVKFLDADDYLGRECIAEQVARMGSDLDWSRALSFLFGADLPGVVPHPAFRPEEPFWTRALGNGTPICAQLVRRARLSGIRFRTDFWYGEDTLFWNDLWRALGRPHFAPVVESATCYVRSHPGQSSRHIQPRHSLQYLTALLGTWDDEFVSQPQVCAMCIRAFETATIRSLLARQGVWGPDGHGARVTLRRLYRLSGHGSNSVCLRLAGAIASRLRRHLARRLPVSWGGAGRSEGPRSGGPGPAPAGCPGAAGGTRTPLTERLPDTGKHLVEALHTATSHAVQGVTAHRCDPSCAGRNRKGTA